MELPLLMQMELDLSVQAHKREIAESFSKLRAKLLPERELVPNRDPLMNYLHRLNAASLQAALAPTWNAMQMSNPFAAQNAAWQSHCGLGGSLIGNAVARGWL